MQWNDVCPPGIILGRSDAFLICKGSRCAIQCGVEFVFCEEQVKRSQRES